MRLETYLINNEKVKVRHMRIGSSLWLHVNGEQWVIDLRPQKTDAKKLGDGDGANASGEILAPMPGKILKVNVKKGDDVASQTTLVVMEAMKMEYNMLAPFAGHVEAVSCEVGQIVELNQQLLKVTKK